VITDGTAKAAETPVRKPEVQTLSVKTYVSDAQLLGLEERTIKISYANKEDKYLAALKALQVEDAKGAVSLWKHAKFLSAGLKDGKLTVNVNLPDAARLGAPGEALALEAIQHSAFQFREVDALDILVDGEIVDSLMGHELLEHPIVKPS
jgi:hypothetical protein